MNNLAIVVSNDNPNVTVFETIDAIKRAGFENVFIQWYDKDFPISQKEQLDYIRKVGLNVIFAHLGYQKVNCMWQQDDEDQTERYLSDLDTLKSLGIDKAMMHLQSKINPPYFNHMGLERFEKIIDYSNKIGIEISFENTRIQEYLKYMLDNSRNQNFGICLDVGHCHCNNKDKVDIDYYKNRIYQVHLHDNFGNHDDHYIPFDGEIDFKYYLKKLKDNGYQGYFTFEQTTLNYKDIDLNQFYQKSYQVGKKIEQMFLEV